MQDETSNNTTGPLHGVRVCDLSRVLAGPSCTQLLGDLGADIIKIERPGAGDDTRAWGPPFLPGSDGADTRESAYYLSANRNKRSIAIDFSKPEGQRLVRAIAAKSDVLVENFKVGKLARLGLDYHALEAENAGLVYCSITGFGQTGPYAARAGYDLLIQAMGGIMSITGQPEVEPTKVGVAIADAMCGMYATVAILAALRERERNGLGQYLDLSLLDTQVAWLGNQGVHYLLSGQTPPRLGNAHPSVVPYQVFQTQDGHVILGIGNDRQFERFCHFADLTDVAGDARFTENENRIRNRNALIPLLEDAMKRRTSVEWIEGLEREGVPCGPVNDLAAVFADPQVRAREMICEMAHRSAAGGAVRLIANPIKFSGAGVSYRQPPPTLGEHSRDVLRELLGAGDEAIEQWCAEGVVEAPPRSSSTS